MTLTITATAGDSSANSFVTEAEVIAYMAARLNASAWTTVTGSTCTENEKKALIEATRELNARAWCGSRVTSTQALAWPRQWVEDPDAAYSATYYDTTSVPQRIKDATMELAFQFLNMGTTDLAALDSTTGVRSQQVDVIAIEYEPSQRPRGLRRFPRIWNLISPLLESTGNGLQVTRG